MDEKRNHAKNGAPEIPDWAHKDFKLWQEARDQRRTAEKRLEQEWADLTRALADLDLTDVWTRLRADRAQLARDLERVATSPPRTGHPVRDLLRRVVWRLTRPALEENLRVQQRTLELLDRLIAAGETQRDRVKGWADRVRSALDTLRDLGDQRDREVLRESGFNVTLQSGRLWHRLRELEAQQLPHIRPEAQRVAQLHLELEELKQALASGKLPAPPQFADYGRPLARWEFPRARDFRYHAFEEIFRGSTDWIREKLKIYEPLFRDAPEPILDIGCGRGEFLQWMRELGKQAYGIEINRYEVERLRAAGFEVRQEPVQEHLQGLPPGSLGGVFCAQVVEHLLPEDLYLTLAGLFRVMKPGAPLVIETVNPLSFYALHQIFFLDPTHIYPVHPETLVFFFRYAGFENVTLHKITPAPAALQLPTPPAQAADPLNDYLRDLVRRLNTLFFDHLEYYVVGYRPGD